MRRPQETREQRDRTLRANRQHGRKRSRHLVPSPRAMADAPAWIGAIGTVGTLTTGLILFGGQIADPRRRHASLVAVWTENVGTGGRYKYRLNIKNHGGQPIYDCRLESTLVLTVPIQGEASDVRSEMNLAFGTIAPGDERTNVAFLEVDELADPSINLDDLVARGLRFRVSFTDTEGRSWIRDERGRLRRLSRGRPKGHISTLTGRVIPREPNAP